MLLLKDQIVTPHIFHIIMFIKYLFLEYYGSIIGENGYNYEALKSKNVENLPEFYRNLKDLKIGIVPKSIDGHFKKKVQYFNNSVGYASKENGNNLIVKEQCLESPSWDIYVIQGNDNFKYNKIKEYLINQKCEYIPYIGKNEHFATITSVKVYNAEPILEGNNIKIDSIFTDNTYLKSNNLLDFDFLFENKEKPFVFKEVLPTKLDSKLGYTSFKEFTYTNQNLNIDNPSEVYRIEEKNIFLF